MKIKGICTRLGLTSPRAIKSVCLQLMVMSQSVYWYAVFSRSLVHRQLTNFLIILTVNVFLLFQNTINDSSSRTQTMFSSASCFSTSSLAMRDTFARTYLINSASLCWFVRFISHIAINNIMVRRGAWGRENKLQRQCTNYLWPTL